MRRSRWLRLAVGTAGLVLLSGCGLLDFLGLGDSDEGLTSEPVEVASTEQVQPTPAEVVPVEPREPTRPVRIGIVTFLSGPSAGPFGIPSRNAAEILIENLNAGNAPPPYSTKGLGGAPIEVVFVDEAGGAPKQAQEFRNLVQQRKVDVVIGYISSGDCMAVAPVAEELKKLTVFFNCGTPRVFEEGSYRYVFRTAGTATRDTVGAALYVTEQRPTLKRLAGINANYEWGQDVWKDFSSAVKALKPEVQITTAQFPKLLAGQYTSEIGAVLAGKPDVVVNSFWGSDLEAFVLQGSQRGLFKKSTVVLVSGEPALHRLASQIPDGTVVGARGPNGVYAPDTEINRWFNDIYESRFALSPNYPGYGMAQAIFGVKAAWEKAQQKAGRAPDIEEVVNAFEHLTYEGPSGTYQLALGKGHQMFQGTTYAMIKIVKGQVSLVNVRKYPPERVNPPEGVKSEDWIRTGFGLSTAKKE